MAKKENTQTRRVTIIIPKPKNVVGDTETVVSVNGEMVQVMYDRAVSVPENIAEVILASAQLSRKIERLCESAALRPNKAAMAEL